MTSPDSSSASTARPKRIGVLGNGFVKWGGGLDFLRQILDGLTTDPSIEIHLFLPIPGWQSTMVRILEALHHALAELVKGRRPRLRIDKGASLSSLAAYFADYVPRISIQFYSGDGDGLKRALAQQNIDVLIPVFGSLPRNFPTPWVSYIYDFQHRHLPHLFSPLERSYRDCWFRRALSSADVVLAISNTVKADVGTFFPDMAHKVRAIPFAPRTKAQWFERDEAAVARKYGLSQPFFLISNQFWIHKEHLTALRAFSRFLALSQTHEFTLVCTGKIEDHRDRDYPDRIARCIKDLGLENKVLLLGHIDKRDQMALMRKARALIQPTLFEGAPGGGAACDAISVGTPVLASDIPVNLEMDCGEVAFFKAGDAEDLARLMLGYSKTPKKDSTLEALLKLTAEREKALNRLLLAMADEAVAARKARP